LVFSFNEIFSATEHRHLESPCPGSVGTIKKRGLQSRENELMEEHLPACKHASENINVMIKNHKNLTTHRDWKKPQSLTPGLCLVTATPCCPTLWLLS